MDPVPGSKEAYENNRPKSAIEEAMVRIGRALEAAHKEYKALPFLSLRRIRLQGVMKALALTFDMCHGLAHKWDNERGECN